MARTMDEISANMKYVEEQIAGTADRGDDSVAELRQQLSNLQGEYNQVQASETSQSQIQSDAQAGVDFAINTLGLGEGSLGRIDTSAYEDLTKGYDAEVLQAQRDQALAEINKSTQTQNRALQAIQQQQGVRGGTAAAQQLSILQSGEDSKADFERDLLINQQEVISDAVNNLTEVQQFNLSQAAQEKYDLAQAGLSYASLGLSERTGQAAADAQVAAAQAASSSSCFDPETVIPLANGTSKAIREVSVGDILLSGGIVTSKMEFLNMDTTFNYNGVKVTGKHAVLHDGTWMRVEDVPEIQEAEENIIVYNLVTTDHRILAMGDSVVVFSDFYENDNMMLSDEECIELLNNEQN